MLVDGLNDSSSPFLQLSQELTFNEKLTRTRILSQAALYGLAKSMGAILRPEKEHQGLGVIRYVYPFVLKYLYDTMPRKLIKAAQTPTKKAIETYCTKKHIPLHSEDIPQGASLHWVGARTSKQVLLYFHGGGYNNPLNAAGHIGFTLKMAAAANASLVMLEYTLAPTAPYPTQLRQATAALAYLLTKYTAEDIIVSGDSAGGHLAVGLMSHLIHPSEKIDPVKLTGKLGGFCFISPFTSFDYNKTSYKENERYDFLNLTQIKDYNANFKPSGMSDSEAIKDPYLSPLDAPSGWFQNAPAEKLLTLLGTWEVFADDCRTFGRRLQNETGNTSDVKLVECARELHVGAIVDTALGLDEKEMAKTILSWMMEFK